MARRQEYERIGSIDVYRPKPNKGPNLFTMLVLAFIALAILGQCTG